MTWMWTMLVDHRRPTHGAAASRETAMVAFAGAFAIRTSSPSPDGLARCEKGSCDDANVCCSLDPDFATRSSHEKLPPCPKSLDNIDVPNGRRADPAKRVVC